MKISWRSCLKVVVSLFTLYLLITYWGIFSNLTFMLIAASSSLILGAAIAFVVNIPMSFFERMFLSDNQSNLTKKSLRALSVVLAFVSVFAIVVIIVRLIVPELYDCVVLLVKEIPPYVEMLWNYLNANFDLNYILSQTGMLPSIETVDWHDLVTKAVNLLVSGLGGVMNSIITLLSTVFSIVVSMLLSFIFSIYLLMSKDQIRSQALRLMNVYFNSRLNEKIFYVLNTVNTCFNRFIVGQCTEAVILGLMSMLGMSLFKFPYSTMIGALIGFTALIPIAGAYIGASVGAFMIFTVSPLKAALFVLFIILLQQFEGNVIYPRVVGKSIGLPGIWVLAAITIGGGIAGIPGMLFGVPLTASIYKLLRTDMHRREKLASGELDPDEADLLLDEDDE